MLGTVSINRRLLVQAFVGAGPRSCMPLLLSTGDLRAMLRVAGAARQLGPDRKTLCAAGPQMLTHLYVWLLPIKAYHRAGSDLGSVHQRWRSLCDILAVRAARAAVRVPGGRPGAT